MRQVTIVILIAALSILLLTGCQGSNASQVRRARLVVDENLQLKKQLEEKNQLIEDLEKQVKEIKLEFAKKKEEFGTTTIKTLKMMAETEKRNRDLLLENAKLKEELEKLKTQ